MRVVIACAIILLLSACSNSGPLQIGKDTYMESVRVSFSGPAGAKSEALQTAAGFCAKQGKQIMLNHMTSGGCMLHGGCGEAEITFYCLNENDPRFQSTQTRTDPNDSDTTTQVPSK